MDDFYRTLRVSPRADEATIKAAYRRLARRVHPDVNPGYGATERMKALNEAYAVLRDPVRRQAYDRERLSLILGGASLSAPSPPAYAPVMWDDDEPLAEARDRWRVVVRAIGTLLALIGIVSLLIPSKPLPAPRAGPEPPAIIQTVGVPSR